MKLKAFKTGLVVFLVALLACGGAAAAWGFTGGIDPIDLTPPGGDPNAPPWCPDINGHWAADYIVDLHDHGAIDGFADNTFRPDANVTRAQFAKMLVAMTAARDTIIKNDPLAKAYYPVIAQDASACKFSDCAGSAWAWARGYIGGAVKAGVIKGYSATTFKPNNPITRAELAAMIGRLLPDSVAKPLNFKDVPDWCRSEVAKAVGVGAVSGFTDGTFRPDAYATRGQVAKMLDCLMNGYDITK